MEKLARNALQKANSHFKNAQFEKAIEAYGDLITSKYLRGEEEESKDGGASSIQEGTTLTEGTAVSSVFGARFDILFDAHMNRCACYSMISEWELALVDGLKCKEMNNKSIKMFARLATAYQGAGDHLACIKECEQGLAMRHNDIALQEIRKKSDRALLEKHMQKGGGDPHSHVGSHDHSHERGHSHSHSHSHEHGRGGITRMGSYESDLDVDEVNGIGLDGGRRGAKDTSSEAGAGGSHSWLEVWCCLG